MEGEAYYICVRCGEKTQNPILSNATMKVYCKSCFRTVFNPYITAKCPECGLEITLLKYDMPLSGVPLCKFDGKQMIEKKEIM